LDQRLELLRGQRLKSSGIGREEGIEELLSYTETKTINVML